MNKERLIIVFLVVIAILGSFILSSGITGMATFDEYTKNLCSSNEDCDNEEICCFFYEENSGVCGKEELCDSILKLTEEEKKKKEEFPLSFSKTTDIQKSIYSNEIIFGSLIVILAIFSAYIYILHSKNISKKSK